MNKTIEKILKEQELLNAKGKYATITKEAGEFIHALIKIKKPKKAIEIGTSIGYSATWIASALPKKGKLICIDRWSERAVLANGFFEKSKLPIELLEGNALDILPKIKTKFDLVFLDATKAEYLQYLHLIKLNKDALIIADNTISHAEKMKDFLSYAKKKGAITLNIGSGITLLTL